MRIKLIILFTFSISLFGCATIQQEALPPISMLKEASQHIESTKVIVGLDPRNSYNFVREVQAADTSQQFGLIGAIISSIIANEVNSNIHDQERLMAPIRSAAIKFNFGSQFRDKFEKKIKPINWLNIDYVSKAPNFQIGKIKEILKSSKEDAVLVADSFYTMSADFSKLTIKSHVNLWPNSKVLINIAKSDITNDKENPLLFRRTFSYEHHFEDEYVSAKSAASGWAKDEGAMVLRGLQTGVNGIAEKISEHIQKSWIIVASR